MIVLQGKGIGTGIAFGKLHFYRRDQQEIAQTAVEDIDAELARYEQAKETALAQLDGLYQKALSETGEKEALLFDIHKIMLEDEDFDDSVKDIITGQRVNAEYAVIQTSKNLTLLLTNTNDPYMKERAADVKDVAQRVVNILLGKGSQNITLHSPMIIAADDLAPSETIQMDRRMILSFVTTGGSTTSHTAILARTMGIPAAVGLGENLTAQYDGADAIVDATTGTLYIDPDAETLSLMQAKYAEVEKKKQLLAQLKGQPNITRDGKEILVYANIGNLTDLDAVLQNDAGGIGLFRSEFLYLESHDYPTEETQFNAYKTVAQALAGKRVIFRTLDIGADKQVAYFNLPKEENPALGMRAIRICLERPEIFKTQLRALYRASAFGKVAIMFPMIASVWEVQKIKEIAREVRVGLQQEGIPFADDVELGIMIETPAAAIISDLLAPEVDFFSIGTNDLTQYTLAVDRQNQELEIFADPHHEAVMRLIRLVTENGHKAGVWTGICGELAADLTLTETFLRMGVDELSVSAPAILPLRAKIRESSVN